jgi:thioredoxin 1
MPEAIEKKSAVLTVNEKTFEADVLQSNVPVLVDFWAPWCGPCRMIAPAVEELGAEFAGKARVAKVNVDENQELAARFNISGIPALLIFKDGKVVDQILGAAPKIRIADRLDRAIA